jgi:hypothetical protein
MSTTYVAVSLDDQIDAVLEQIKLALQVFHSCCKDLPPSPLLQTDAIPHHAGSPHTQQQIFVPFIIASRPNHKRCFTTH